MESYIYYLGISIGIILLIISLEWDRVKRISLVQLITVLIVLFFLGSAVASLFQ